eukprot:gene26561-22450_t
MLQVTTKPPPPAGCDGVAGSGKVKDACGVCSGPGLNTAGCCGSQAKDVCSVCGGPGKDACGTCGGSGCTTSSSTTTTARTATIATTSSSTTTATTGVNSTTATLTTDITTVPDAATIPAAKPTAPGAAAQLPPPMLSPSPGAATTVVYSTAVETGDVIYVADGNGDPSTANGSSSSSIAQSSTQHPVVVYSVPHAN